MRLPLVILTAIGLQASAMEPDAPELRESLLLWLRADTLKLKDGDPVFVWPDTGGRGHDLTPTKGTRMNGIGTAPRFVIASEVGDRGPGEVWMFLRLAARATAKQKQGGGLLGARATVRT